MKELYTEIAIDAPPSRVFEILTDLEKYPEWNPFIVQAIGNLQIGSKLDIRIRPPGAKEKPYVVTVLEVEKDHKFSWLGHMGRTGILDGEHVFKLVPQKGGSTKLIHREKFRGLLVPFVWRWFLNTTMRAGFEDLNRGLKTAAEKQAPEIST